MQGKGFNLNVPLKPGLASSNFVGIVENILRVVLQRFTPEVIIVVAGADGLAGDPLGFCNETKSTDGWNLGVDALASAIALVKDIAPLLVLGGGGYNHANAARAWTCMMSVLTGTELSIDTLVPDCVVRWHSYGPHFSLEFDVGSRLDENCPEDIDALFREYKKLL